jgi:co-chaperonin GroES (HSP10)
LNKHVVFTPIKETITASSSGLLVVQHTSGDTPSGRVKMIAADSCSELENSTIYYDNANFFNAFELDQAEYSFIKEDDIIVYATEE